MPLAIQRHEPWLVTNFGILSLRGKPASEPVADLISAIWEIDVEGCALAMSLMPDLFARISAEHASPRRRLGRATQENCARRLDEDELPGSCRGLALPERDGLRLSPLDWSEPYPSLRIPSRVQPSRVRHKPVRLSPLSWSVPRQGPARTGRAAGEVPGGPGRLSATAGQRPCARTTGRSGQPPRALKGSSAGPYSGDPSRSAARSTSARASSIPTWAGVKKRGSGVKTM